MSSPGVPRVPLHAALAALLLALAAPAGAQSGKGDYVGSWSAAAAVGYAVPNTDEYDNAFAWRLAGSYSPLPQFEIGLEIGRFSTQVSQPDANGISPHTIASGTVEVRPVCLTAQYRRPLPDLFSTLTLLAGVGYYFLDYAMADEARAVFEAGGVRGLPDQSVDDAWGAHLGAGIEYALTERLSLVGEGRYVFLSPEASGTASPGRSIDGSLDLDTWLFSGGLKFTF
jgi:outer membrane protein W